MCRQNYIRSFLIFLQQLEFSSRLCRAEFFSGCKFFGLCVYSLLWFNPALVYFCCCPVSLLHLPFMVFSCISASPVLSSCSLLFFCLPPLISVYNLNFFSVSLHHCPVLLLQISLPLCYLPSVWPRHLWGDFLLSGLCSPQCKATHRNSQVLVLYTGELVLWHRAQPLLSFCTFGRERSWGKGIEGTQFKIAKICSFSVKEKEDTEEKVLLCPCRPR